MKYTNVHVYMVYNIFRLLIAIIVFKGFNITFAQVPANDECNEATEISSLPYNDDGNTMLATSDVTPPPCDVMETDVGVWYTYRGTGSDVKITVRADFTIKIGVFIGSCNNLSCVAGSDGSTTSTTWSADDGEEYLILLIGESAATGEYNVRFNEANAQSKNTKSPKGQVPKQSPTNKQREPKSSPDRTRDPVREPKSRPSSKQDPVSSPVNKRAPVSSPVKKRAPKSSPVVMNRAPKASPDRTKAPIKESKSNSDRTRAPVKEPKSNSKRAPISGPVKKRGPTTSMVKKGVPVSQPIRAKSPVSRPKQTPQQTSTPIPSPQQTSTPTPTSVPVPVPVTTKQPEGVVTDLPSELPTAEPVLNIIPTMKTNAPVPKQNSNTICPDGSVGPIFPDECVIDCPRNGQPRIQGCVKFCDVKPILGCATVCPRTITAIVPGGCRERCCPNNSNDNDEDTNPPSTAPVAGIVTTPTNDNDNNDGNDSTTHKLFKFLMMNMAIGQGKGTMYGGRDFGNRKGGRKYNSENTGDDQGVERWIPTGWNERRRMYQGGLKRYRNI